MNTPGPTDSRLGRNQHPDQMLNSWDTSKPARRDNLVRTNAGTASVHKKGIHHSGAIFGHCYLRVVARPPFLNRPPSFVSDDARSPISEAAITGVEIGLAISYRRSFVEIMFGDFITYAFDEIIKNASKFFHMYNHQLEYPVIVRTPMGGRRGYSPTHSQSLERLLPGKPEFALGCLRAARPAAGMGCPAIVLENKTNYTSKSLRLKTGSTSR